MSGPQFTITIYLNPLDYQVWGQCHRQLQATEAKNSSEFKNAHQSITRESQ